MTERQQKRQQWLEQLFPDKPFTETPASEDASFRSYYRVNVGERSFIVMDAPPQHEDCKPFIDVTQRLLECDVNVPRIYEQDLVQGYLLLSDLGDEQYLPNLQDSSSDRLYRLAIESIALYASRPEQRPQVCRIMMKTCYKQK